MFSMRASLLFCMAWAIRGGATNCPCYTFICERPRVACPSTTGDGKSVDHQCLAALVARRSHLWDYNRLYRRVPGQAAGDRVGSSEQSEYPHRTLHGDAVSL